MHTDYMKTEGSVRLVCRKLSPFWTKIEQLADFLGRNDISTKIVERFGVLKWDTGEMHNLGATNRLPVISGLYVGSGSQTAFTYLAVGTSSTAVSAAHTGLQAEITDSGLARASATASRTTTTSTNDTSQLAYTWTASGSKTVEEIGYFNASSGVTMGGRALTGTKSLVSGDTLTATYKIKHT